MKIRTLVVLGVAAVAVLAPPAQAQAFPDRPIRIVVSRPPGGASDLIARAIAVKLTEKWGQSVIVDNQPGANGVIATGIVAKAPKDGYTWLLADDAHPVNPHLQKEMPFDTLKDFTPVSLLATQSMVLVVNPSVPANTLQEFVALAKASPGKYAYSSAGIGSAQHLSALGIANAAGIDMLHVPYKSGAVVGVIGGEVSVFVPSVASILPMVQAGRVKALAVTSDKRSDALPNVPTVRESGYPFEFVAWEGVIVPAGTPAPVVKKIQDTLIEVMAMPDIQKQLGDKMTLVGSTSAQFSKRIADDYVQTGKALAAAGALPQ